VYILNIIISHSHSYRSSRPIKRRRLVLPGAEKLWSGYYNLDKFQVCINISCKAAKLKMTPLLLLLSLSYAHGIFISALVQTTEANALRLDSFMYDIQYMAEKMTKHNGNSANEIWSRVPLGEPQYSMTCLATNWNRSFPEDATTTGPLLFVVTILCCCDVGSWGFAVCCTTKTNKKL